MQHRGQSLPSMTSLFLRAILVLFDVLVGVTKPVLWAPFLQRPTHKRKGGQVRFSSDQTLQLEKKFNIQKYMSPQERKRLAKSLKLTERQVVDHYH